MLIKRRVLSVSFFFALLAILIVDMSFSNASAAPDLDGGTAPVKTYTMEEKATRWTYYRALSYCIINSEIDNEITTENLNAGEIFAQGGGISLPGSWAVPIGNYFGELPEGGWADSDYDDSMMHCSSGGWVKNAFVSLGFSNINDAALSLGFTKEDRYSDGVMYWDLPDPESKIDITKFRGLVAYYGNPELTYDDAVQYYQELRVFSAGCIGKNDFLNSDPLTEEQRDTLEDKYEYNVFYYDGVEEYKNNIYEGIRDHNRKIYYRINIDEDSGDNVQARCIDILNSINNRFDAYKTEYDKIALSGEETPSPGGDDSSLGSSASSSATTCAVQGAGWIVCPIINLMAGISDAAYGRVSDLLTTPPVINSPSSPSGGVNIYEAWSMMRNIANIVFVIAFLVIIFSQLTGAGVTNYGVKKILPRIVIAAILVNLSYYICAIGVDISNIIGKSLSGLFENLGASLSAPDFSKSSSGWTTGKGWQGVAGFVLTSGAAATISYFAGLSVLVPALFTVLIAIVAVFLTLAARQAILIILIVISPLAFVAYLLPNTEQWFKKWGKMLGTLLALYPLIAVVFGGASLASTIIMGSASDTIVAIMGAVVGVVPLFMLPSLMKFGGNAIGQINGIVKGGAGKLSSPLQKRASEAYDNSRFEQLRNYRKGEANKRRALVQGGSYAGENRILKGLSSAHGFINSRTGKFGERSAASGISVARGMLEEDIKAEAGRMETMSSEEILKFATSSSSSEAQRTAAIRQVMKVGNLGDRRAVYGASSTASELGRASIRDGYFARGDHQVFGATLGDTFIKGDADGSKLTAGLWDQLSGGKISAATLASDKDIAELVRDTLGDLDADTKAKVAAQAQAAMNLPGTSEKLTSTHRDILSEMSGNGRTGGLIDQHGNPL